MENTISIAEFKKLNKEGRVGKKQKGDKAKSEMYATVARLTKQYGGVHYEELKFDIVRKFKFDFAIVVSEAGKNPLKIAIEYEGLMSEKSGHTTITGYTSNCEKYNLACVLGWKVLRYTALNYKDLERDLNKLLK